MAGHKNEIELLSKLKISRQLVAVLLLAVFDRRVIVVGFIDAVFMAGAYHGKIILWFNTWMN